LGESYRIRGVSDFGYAQGAAAVAYLMTTANGALNWPLPAPAVPNWLR
jgi:hypothetical protein